MKFEVPGVASVQISATDYESKVWAKVEQVIDEAIDALATNKLSTAVLTAHLFEAMAKRCDYEASMRPIVLTVVATP